jgi:simple sugar transport system permease protein
MMEFLIAWWANVPEAAAAYALAALGLLLCERSGVLNLTAEGLMLVGAMAAMGSALQIEGYPGMALVVGMLAAALVSLLFALLVVTLRVNQVIAGLAIVFFCQGFTQLLGVMFDWQNHPVPGLLPVRIPLLADIPIIGRVLFEQNGVVYLIVPIFFAVQWVLHQTRAGLRLRSVGENPEAADAAGVSVPLVRFGAIVAGSALIGLAGGLLSVGGVKMWFPDMAGGRGWIAVALVIFARWQPWRALAGAVLFGCIESLIPRIAAAGIRVPQYFMLMAPYVVTLAVMAWTAWKGRGRSSEPGALGQPFSREERR